MTNNKKGFTLIELLVVIAIIGLLSTLAVVALGSARIKARDAKRMADLRQIQTALELYYSDNTGYPSITGTASLGDTDHACLNSTGWAATGCANAYMALVPQDPSGNGVYYTYTAGAITSYTIGATLEGTVNGMAGAIQATPSGITDVVGS